MAIIKSETPTSSEEKINGIFCQCYHLFEEHSNGKCYGLDYNETTFKACDCKNPKPLVYKIGLKINENSDQEDRSEEDSQSEIESSKSKDENKSSSKISDRETKFKFQLPTK